MRSSRDDNGWHFAAAAMLDARLDLPHTPGLTLTDEWLDLSVGLSWSQAAGVWCFPIQTVSQSEAGLEGVYQSSAIMPHWHVTADKNMVDGRSASADTRATMAAGKGSSWPRVNTSSPQKVRSISRWRVRFGRA